MFRLHSHRARSNITVSGHYNSFLPYKVSINSLNHSLFQITNNITYILTVLSEKIVFMFCELTRSSSLDEDRYTTDSNEYQPAWARVTHQTKAETDQ